MTSNLEHRQDNRTIEEFAHDISSWTKRENRWAEVFKAQLESKGQKVKVIDYGVDGSGSLITSDKVTAAPDKAFIVDNTKFLIEIKTAYVQENISEISCLTYKVSSLKTCLTAKAYILTVNKNWLMVMDTNSIQYLLNNYTAQIYDKFSPNDPAIRLFNSDIQKLYQDNILKFKSWVPAAKVKIEEFKQELF